MSDYGFKNKIIYGFNTTQIDIQNFDKRKLNQMKKYLQRTMGKNLTHCEPFTNGNRCTLSLLMMNPKAACQWLDNLLIDK